MCENIVNTFTRPETRALIEQAARDLEDLARQAEDKDAVRVFNKVAYHLACGLVPVWSAGDLLVPSGTRASVIHRVSYSRPCSCEAGEKGVSCWHSGVLEAWDRASTLMDREERKIEATAAALEVPKWMVEAQELFA